MSTNEKEFDNLVLWAMDIPQNSAKQVLSDDKQNMYTLKFWLGDNKFIVYYGDGEANGYDERPLPDVDSPPRLQPRAQEAWNIFSERLRTEAIQVSFLNAGHLYEKTKDSNNPIGIRRGGDQNFEIRHKELGMPTDGYWISLNSSYRNEALNEFATKKYSKYMLLKIKDWFDDQGSQAVGNLINELKLDPVANDGYIKKYACFVGGLQTISRSKDQRHIDITAQLNEELQFIDDLDQLNISSYFQK